MGWGGVGEERERERERGRERKFRDSLHSARERKRQTDIQAGRQIDRHCSGCLRGKVCMQMRLCVRVCLCCICAGCASNGVLFPMSTRLRLHHRTSSTKKRLPPTQPRRPCRRSWIRSRLQLQVGSFFATPQKETCEGRPRRFRPQRRRNVCRVRSGGDVRGSVRGRCTHTERETDTHTHTNFRELECAL